MKEKIKCLNPLQIISNLLLLVVLIVVIVTKNDRMYALYWMLISVVMVCNIYFIGKWSKRGVDIDKKKSKEVSRSLDDITTVVTVFYVLIYLGILFMESFIDDIKINLYVAIGFYVLTVVYELFTYSAVYSAIRDTKKLISEKFAIKK